MTWTAEEVTQGIHRLSSNTTLPPATIEEAATHWWGETEEAPITDVSLSQALQRLSRVFITAGEWKLSLWDNPCVGATRVLDQVQRNLSAAYHGLRTAYMMSHGHWPGQPMPEERGSETLPLLPTDYDYAEVIGGR